MGCNIVFRHLTFRVVATMRASCDINKCNNHVINYKWWCVSLYPFKNSHINSLFGPTITNYPPIFLSSYLSILAFYISHVQRKTPLDFMFDEALAQRYSRVHGSPLKHVSVAINGPLGIHSSHYLHVSSRSLDVELPHHGFTWLNELTVNIC